MKLNTESRDPKSGQPRHAALLQLVRQIQCLTESGFCGYLEIKFVGGCAVQTKKVEYLRTHPAASKPA